MKRKKRIRKEVFEALKPLGIEWMNVGGGWIAGYWEPKLIDGMAGEFYYLKAGTRKLLLVRRCDEVRVTDFNRPFLAHWMSLMNIWFMRASFYIDTRTESAAFSMAHIYGDQMPNKDILSEMIRESDLIMEHMRKYGYHVAEMTESPEAAYRRMERDLGGGEQCQKNRTSFLRLIFGKSGRPEA